jgi:hypothetical protein
VFGGWVGERYTGGESHHSQEKRMQTKYQTRNANHATDRYRPRLLSLFFSALLSFVFFFFISTPVEAAVIIQRPLFVGLSNGLVGYWSFDGGDMGTTSAYDLSGNDNIGWTIGGPKKTIGKIGQALEFDGVNDYITMGDVGGSIQTISFWMKAPDVTSKKLINIDGADQIETSASDQVVATSFPAATVYVDGVLTSSVRDGQWHHVTVLDTIGVSGTTFEVGRVSSTYFDGLIDDVRVYNRALSPQEIQRLYKIGGTFTVNKPQSPSLTSLGTGLVGYWSFDGGDMGTTSAFDTSGNNNTGWLTNGPKKSKGKLGQGVLFDGVDDYVSAPAATSINNLQNGMTISGWIRPTITPPSDTRLISKRDSTGWGLNANIGALTTSLVFLANFSGGSLRAVSNGGAFTVGAWTHVVAVWDGTLTSANVKFYANGTLIGHATDLDGIGTVSDDSGSPLSIGALSGGTNQFTGSIDEVRIYDRMLSPDEIKRLYQMGR